MESCDQGSSLQSTVGIVLGLMGAPTTSLMTSHSLGMSMDGIDVSNISLFEGSKNQGFDEM